MTAKKYVDFILQQNVSIHFTKAEAAVLAQMLRPIANGSFNTASERARLEAAVWDKLKDGFKKALKTAITAIIPLLILVPTASGMTIKDPKGFAKTVEKVANDKAQLDLKIEAKEVRKGNLQTVVFEIKGAGGSHATINFLGTDNDALNNLELRSGQDNGPEFDAFVQTWYDTLQDGFVSAK